MLNESDAACARATSCSGPLTRVVRRLLLAGTAVGICLFPASAGMKAQGANPLLVASTLSYSAPNFAIIQDSDYEPALRQGMREQQEEVQQIVRNVEPPTFENTIEAM